MSFSASLWNDSSPKDVLNSETCIQHVQSQAEPSQHESDFSVSPVSQSEDSSSTKVDAQQLPVENMIDENCDKPSWTLENKIMMDNMYAKRIFTAANIRVIYESCINEWIM